MLKTAENKPLTYSMNNILYGKDIEDGEDGFSHNSFKLDYHRYEYTITFDPRYYTKHSMLWKITSVIEEIAKAYKSNDHYYLSYVVEYHKNGSPHIHISVLCAEQILETKHMNLDKKLYRIYGKCMSYYTGLIEYDHDGRSWGTYLLKDYKENNKNNPNLEHYFSYIIVNRQTNENENELMKRKKSI